MKPSQRGGLLLALGILIVLAPQARAGAFYELNVSPFTLGESEYLGWRLEFSDLDDDATVSLNEVTFFSGIAFTQSGVTNLFDTLTGVPSLAGIADGSGSAWSFSRTSGTLDLGITIYTPTYMVSEIADTHGVATPATLALLLAGLCGVRLTRSAPARR